MEKRGGYYWFADQKERSDIQILELNEGKKGRHVIDVLFHPNALEGNGVRVTYGRLGRDGKTFNICGDSIIRSRSEIVEEVRANFPGVRLIKLIDFPKF